MNAPTQLRPQLIEPKAIHRARLFQRREEFDLEAQHGDAIGAASTLAVGFCLLQQPGRLVELDDRPGDKIHLGIIGLLQRLGQACLKCAARIPLGAVVAPD